MHTTVTNRRQWFGTIDIRRQLIGNILVERAAHGLGGFGLERPVDTGAMRHVAGMTRANNAIDRLRFVHLYPVRAARMRQNESAGLKSFRIDRKSTRLNSSHRCISYA